jgi:hypothetical protein
MAGLGFWLGNRHYPIPVEWRRLSKIVLAAAMAFVLSALAPGNPWAAVPLKAFACALFPVALWAFGFFREDEIRWLRSLGAPNRRRTWSRSP